jgi:bifunctional DNase/RNase
MEVDNVNNMIELIVKTVTVDMSGNFTVLLVDKQEEKMVLPMVVGAQEAHNIAMPIQGVTPPRPMTPDLLKNAIEKLGGVPDKVVITSMKGNAYTAEIHIKQKDQTIVLDSRPSDAMALALRCDIPIFMNKWLVEFTYDISDIKP